MVDLAVDQQVSTAVGLSDVCLSFGGVQVLDHVSFSVGADQWWALIGPNGSGKTSTLNVITGFYRPQSGSVSYRGDELLGLATHSRQRSGIVRTFQHPILSERLTILDNVLLGAERLPLRVRAAERRRANDAAIATALDLLDRLACADYVHRCAAEAPFGVRKRAEIARAMLANPSVLLLDEPAAGLSDDERVEVIRALRAMRSDQHTAAVVIEHDVRFVAQLCEKAIALDFGHVVTTGATAEVLAEPAVRAAFLGEK